MTESLVIDPTRIFEIKGNVCEVDTVLKLATGATDNQLVITASSTGQKIRVMGWQAQTNGAGNTTVNFRNGSGGTVKTTFAAPSNVQTPYLVPIVNSGYFSTSVNTGLYVGIGGADGGIITVFYLYYTP